jgi:serine/threonine protein kinase
MSTEQRLWTAYAITDAVAYASGQCGISHHDLKPANILLQQMPGDTWAVPKIVDWGLSRELIQHDGSISQATPKYAAPEQNPAIMPGAEAGVHTDVYQLGVVCYELLTGHYPTHLHGGIPKATDRNPALPDDIDEILTRALAHDRQQRYDHPIEFRNALEEILSTRGQSSIPTEPRGGDPRAGTDDYEDESVDDKQTPREQTTETWPTFQGGPARTGYKSTTGPKDSVTAQWCAKVGESGLSSPIVAGDTIYVGCDSGIYALDKKSGTNLWCFRTSEPILGPPTVANESVYFGCYDGNVYALNARDGSKHWCLKSDGPVYVSPAVVVF